VNDFTVVIIVVVLSKTLKFVLTTERPIFKKKLYPNLADKSSYDFCEKKSYFLVTSFSCGRYGRKFVFKCPHASNTLLLFFKDQNFGTLFQTTYRDRRLCPASKEDNLIFS